MASSVEALSMFGLEEELTCSICLCLFQTPVTTPCGHNFCLPCLEMTWMEFEEKFSCPQCRASFETRPELKKNTVLCKVVEQFQISQDGLSQGCTLLFALFRLSSPTKPRPSSPVPCDNCLVVDATKTCLTCMASFCQEHLGPHLESPAFKGHQLVPPVKELQQKKCQAHTKLLEFFCHEHRVPICCFCLLSHKTCSTTPLKEAKEAKELQLKKRLTELSALNDKTAKSLEQVRTQQKQLSANLEDPEFQNRLTLPPLTSSGLSPSHLSAVAEIETCGSTISFSAPCSPEVERSHNLFKVMWHFSKSFFILMILSFQNTTSWKLDLLKSEFREILALIHEEEQNSWKKIKSEEKRVLDKFEFVHTVLGKKKNEIQMERGEIEVILAEMDDITFLKRATKRRQISFSDVFVPKIELDQNVLGAVYQKACNLKEVTKRFLNITQEEKIKEQRSRPAKRSESPKPRARSSGKAEPKSETTTLDTFLTKPREEILKLLSFQCFKKGIHYWEVDLENNNFCAVGICYGSIPRRGPESRLGRNSSSWCIEWVNNKVSAWHNGKDTALPTSKATKIGVLLNYDGGFVIFFGVTEKKIFTLYKFKIEFTEAVYSAFWVFSNGATISICQLKS
ncbi:E3 ubiquitin/ISG15 ligase TRIM25, partial [Ophiophagus hannah]